MKEFIKVVKFVLFSLSAGVIELVSYTILSKIVGIDSYWLTYLPALVLSVLWNFTLNRNFTFKDTSNVPKAMVKVFCYYLVFTPISTWWGDLLIKKLLWNDTLVTILNMLINLVTEFLYQRFFVFNNKSEK